MLHVMVDLESLSLRPNASILAIGAVVLGDSEVGAEFHAKIDPRLSGTEYHVDSDTVLWWLAQSDGARAEAASGTEYIANAVLRFSTWLARLPPYKLWANSPSEDVVWLEHAFRVQGYAIPWDHRDVCDLRTLAYMRDPEGLLKPEDDDTKHTALGDARWQARYLARLFEEGT